ncbi:MAG: DUF2188 domain-containing protein [Ignavibacteriaceae bacterium]
MSKVYVTPHKTDWAVKQEGANAIISVYNTKKEAIEAAKEIAIGREAELIILKKDGTIDNLGVYPTDPFPSKNKGPEYNNEGDEGV